MENEKVQVILDEASEGLRLDVVLSRLVPEVSRNAIQRLIRAGEITVCGEAFSPSRKASIGDVLEYSPEVLQDEIVPEDIPLDILYEDQHILVINKAAGLVVHPNAHEKSGTLVNALLAHCPDVDFQEMMDYDERPGIVHRLDKFTTGVLVVAKNRQASDKLREDFKQHLLRKTYLAIIVGRPEKLSGEIRLPIGRDPVSKSKMCVLQTGKEAWTEYRTVASKNGASVVKIRLHTGRTHQIRVHFAAMGNPVLGDIVYGMKPEQEPYHAPRQMLHAWKIAFRHPISNKSMRFCATLPDDFLEALSALGISAPP
ncbi:MAG: RluA family pseudouridine synthase [Victivallales bacterium]|nr:RluA family pseudouridine synthase [Victivallales bacterium]